MIMWPEAHRALNRLPFGLQRFWLKFATGFLGTAQKLQIRGYQDNSLCPRCGADGEDNVHVLKCPQVTAKWKTHHLAFQLELRKLHTAPELATAILHNLDAWWNTTPPFIPPTNHWGEREAVLAQQETGWTNFVFGRWHRQWAVAQGNYLKSQDSKLSLRRWTAALIHKLYMTAWDFWDHRNKVLHAAGGPRALAVRAQLHARIRAEYMTGPTGLHPPEAQLLCEPLHVLLNGTTATKKRWLQSVHLSRTLAREQRLTADQIQLRRQQSLMQQWLQSQTP